MGDLADVSELKGSNSKVRFLLVVVDSFSRKASVQPLLNKTTEATTYAMSKAIKELRPSRNCLLTLDNGHEFRPHKFMDLMRKHDINVNFTRTPVKSSQAEIFIRHFKTLIHKFLAHNKTKTYLPHLQNLVKLYNSRKHSAHGYAPSSVNERNSGLVFEKLYHRLMATKPPLQKFQNGDLERVSSKRITFFKALRGMFSKSIYKVVKTIWTPPVYSYILSTLAGEVIENTKFVEDDLAPANE